MRCRSGWTLVELLVVVAILSLLAGVLAPSLDAARQQARLIACQANLHDIGVAMISYVAMHNRKLPPFAFSDLDGSVPASGHWGGPSQGMADPTMFGRFGAGAEPLRINLWALVHENLIDPGPLICPAAAPPLRCGDASYFPYTGQFSTYCLRFPTSEAMFGGAPNLKYRLGPTLLSIYRAAPGGWRWPVGGGSYEIVPQVRFDRSYPPLAALGRDPYDVPTDAMLADTFWWQDMAAETEPRGGVKVYPVRAGWCHGRTFNVLYGGGSVHTVTDDGTVAANSIPPGGSLDNDGHHFASYAERIWTYFDRPRR